MRQSTALIVLVIIGFIFLPNIFAADTPSEEDPNRFIGVERWAGTLDIETTEEWGSLDFCGSEEIPELKIKRNYGYAWNRNWFKATSHYNVDLSFVNRDQEDTEDSTDPADKALDQMAAKMEKMFGQVAGDKTENPGGFFSWGRIGIGDKTKAIGRGTRSWHRKALFSCPNGRNYTIASGSDSTDDIEASLAIYLYRDMDPEYQSSNFSVYGISAITHTPVLGDEMTRKRWNYLESYCSSPAYPTGCLHTGLRSYTITNVYTHDRYGNHKHYFRTTKVDEPEKSYTEHTKGTPHNEIMEGGFSNPHKVVDLSPGREVGLVKPLPEKSISELRNPAIMKKHKEQLKELNEKINIKLPKTGMVLQGETTRKYDDHDSPGFWKKGSTKFRWYLTPTGKSEFEVEVEIVNYDYWLPKGNVKTELSGNVMVIKARLMDPKTGKKAKAKAEKFIFELRNTSKVKGVAMNWPKDKANADYDFKFEYKENSKEEFEIENEKEGQIIKTRGNISSDSMTVRLSSFDWGAYGELYVKAIMPGGLTAEGHYKGKPAGSKILIPKRDEISYIADAWKKERGLDLEADESDTEDKPKGDGYKGDGFTLYEEYRGFYTDDPGEITDRDHFYGNPNLKELFVDDRVADPDSRNGIRMYERATGINVRVISSNFLTDERVVNFNYQGGPGGHIDQHGIVMVRFPSDEFAGEADAIATPKEGGNVRINPIPNESEKWEHISTGTGTVIINQFPRTIAHELGHTSCLPHHGEGDLGFMEWKEGTSEGQSEVMEKKKKADGDGHAVSVWREGFSGKVVPKTFKDTYPLWVAVKHGQHSGVENCFMRYDVALAYDPADGGSSNQRKWFPDNREIPGSTLCRKKKDRSKSYQRYGEAVNGECEMRLRVSDRDTNCKSFVG